MLRSASIVYQDCDPSTFLHSICVLTIAAFAWRPTCADVSGKVMLVTKLGLSASAPVIARLYVAIRHPYGAGWMDTMSGRLPMVNAMVGAVEGVAR